MDREARRAAVHGVTKSQTQLSNWTDLSIVKSLFQDLFVLIYTQVTSIWASEAKNSLHFHHLRHEFPGLTNHTNADNKLCGYRCFWFSNAKLLPPFFSGSLPCLTIVKQIHMEFFQFLILGCIFIYSNSLGMLFKRTLYNFFLFKILYIHITINSHVWSMSKHSENLTFLYTTSLQVISLQVWYIIILSICKYKISYMGVQNQ